MGINLLDRSKELKTIPLSTLAYNVHKTSAGLEISPSDGRFRSVGRRCFLQAVDEEYADACIDPETHRNRAERIRVN